MLSFPHGPLSNLILGRRRRRVPAQNDELQLVKSTASMMMVFFHNDLYFVYGALCNI
jgi:hypothetical protein